jgi:alpha-L-glutamate ligase-like protein
VRIVRALRRAGILGINERNHTYMLPWNRRERYPNVDDKLRTKRICARAGIPTAGVLGVARVHAEIRDLVDALDAHASFVLKPAHGAMGNGILVVRGRDGDRFVRSGGTALDREEIAYHAASIVSGLFALGGQPDAAFAEERLEVHPELSRIATEGVPDVRIVVFRGIPVMAMTRLPTRRARGRANLHQGAVGAGIDLETGRTLHAVLAGRPVRLHPDTQENVVGRQIPDFDVALEIAVRAADASGLGYVGADVVVDATRGPLILELNARPGLAIQVANRAGLLPRLKAAEAHWTPDVPLQTRLARGRAIARSAA